MSIRRRKDRYRGCRMTNLDAPQVHQNGAYRAGARVSPRGLSRRRPAQSRDGPARGEWVSDTRGGVAWDREPADGPRGHVGLEGQTVTPAASVAIPVLNDREGLRKVLDALDAQCLRSSLEIIVIDN